MQETALIKDLSPKQQKAAEAYASRAKRATLAALRERMPHLADNSINAAEHIGREQHQLAVGEDDLAVLGDDAEAVAIANRLA